MARPESSRLVPPCPCPSLTAYWSPPPAWPRLVFCEIPTRLLHALPCCSHLNRLSNAAILLAVSTILLAYFVVMDIFLFDRFRYTSLADDAGAAGATGELYSPFTHLSVKAVLSDHPRHYIFTPSTELFNSLTHFTERLPFVSANAVSITHLICAFIAGKFVASENLSDRRIGVGIFFFRTWLDSFDGIVYRAHAGRHLQYNSGYSSIGYFVDGFVDTLGGNFLSFGVLFYLWKRFAVLPNWMSASSQSSPFSSTRKGSIPIWAKPCSNTPHPMSSSIKSSKSFGEYASPHDEAAVVLIQDDSSSIKILSSNSPDISNIDTKDFDYVTIRCRYDTGYSRMYLFLKVFAYGCALLIAGGAWDRAVKMYTEVFQVQLSDARLSILQFELSHSTATMAIFFLWRFISGQTLLTYMQLAIFIDKIWEYLHIAPWVFLLVTIPLYGISIAHVQSIRTQLHLDV